MREDYIKLVDDLNNELYDNNKETHLSFSYTTNGYIDVILFEEVHLWDSENDDRNDKEREKPLISHIKSLYNKYVDHLIKLKFKKIRKK